MEELKVGQKFTNGKLSREIVRIDDCEIYYKNEKAIVKHCWITTFQDWVNRIRKADETVTYKYEVIYTQEGKEHITTDDIQNIKDAKVKANKYKEDSNISNIKIAEYKTIRKIIQV